MTKEKLEQANNLFQEIKQLEDQINFCTGQSVDVKVDNGFDAYKIDIPGIQEAIVSMLKVHLHNLQAKFDAL